MTEVKPRLVSVKDACEYAGMGRTKLYQKLNGGIIVARKRDGQTLIDLNSIDAMNENLPRFIPRAKL